MPVCVTTGGIVNTRFSPLLDIKVFILAVDIGKGLDLACFDLVTGGGGVDGGVGINGTTCLAFHLAFFYTQSWC